MRVNKIIGRYKNILEFDTQSEIAPSTVILFVDFKI